MKFDTLHQMVKLARENLDRDQWDYLMGGADTESALRRNRFGLDGWVFRSRILRDVSEVETGSELLGCRLRIPVVLAPIGSLQIFEGSGSRTLD